MNRNLENINWRYLIIVSIFFAALSAIKVYVSIAALVISLLYLLLYYLGEKYILPFIVVTFLTITQGLNPSLRVIVQITNIVLLLYLFIKKFGLKFSEYPRVPRNIQILITAFILLMMISTLFSNYPHLGWPQLFRSVQFFIIVYLIYSLIADFHDVRYILYSLIIVAIIYTSVLWINFYQSGFDISQFLQRFFGTEENYYANKNSMGGTFAVSVPLLLAFFNKSNSKIKLIYLLLICFIISGLLLTNSRGAVVALIVGCLFVLFKMNIRIFKVAITLILGVVLLLFFTPLGSLFELFLRIDSISTGRDWIFQSTFEVIKENFWIGVGPAATKFEMFKNIPFLIGTPVEIWFSHHLDQIEFGHAHNFYLFMFTDLGFGGFILALAIPFIFFKNTIKIFLNFDKNDSYSLVTIGIYGAGLSVFIRGLFEWSGLISYGFISNDLPFWILFCILTYMSLRVKNTNGTE